MAALVLFWCVGIATGAFWNTNRMGISLPTTLSESRIALYQLVHRIHRQHDLLYPKAQAMDRLINMYPIETQQGLRNTDPIASQLVALQHYYVVRCQISNWIEKYRWAAETPFEHLELSTEQQDTFQMALWLLRQYAQQVLDHMLRANAGIEQCQHFTQANATALLPLNGIPEDEEVEDFQSLQNELPPEGAQLAQVPWQATVQAAKNLRDALQKQLPPVQWGPFYLKAKQMALSDWRRILKNLFGQTGWYLVDYPQCTALDHWVQLNRFKWVVEMNVNIEAHPDIQQLQQQIFKGLLEQIQLLRKELYQRKQKPVDVGTLQTLQEEFEAEMPHLQHKVRQLAKMYESIWPDPNELLSMFGGNDHSVN